jgi:hypothetical protein
MTVSSTWGHRHSPSDWSMPTLQAADWLQRCINKVTSRGAKCLSSYTLCTDRVRELLSQCCNPTRLMFFLLYYVYIYVVLIQLVLHPSEEVEDSRIILSFFLSCRIVDLCGRGKSVLAVVSTTRSSGMCSHPNKCTFPKLADYAEYSKVIFVEAAEATAND